VDREVSDEFKNEICIWLIVRGCDRGKADNGYVVGTWNTVVNPKCPSLRKCILPMKKEHGLLIIPNEANSVFFKI